MTNYTTIQGDMWDYIAYKVYGNEKYIKLLMNANQEYRDYAVFPQGIRLVCPDIPVEDGPTYLPPWRQ